MDENFVWCALIIAMAYIFRDTLPSYSELTEGSRRLNAINDAVDDMEQTVLAVAKSVEDMRLELTDPLREGSLQSNIDDTDNYAAELEGRIEVLESDVGGHLTRLDDMSVALDELDVRGAVDELEAAHRWWMKDADQIEYRILLIEDKLGMTFDLKAYEAIGHD